MSHYIFVASDISERLRVWLKILARLREIDKSVDASAQKLGETSSCNVAVLVARILASVESRSGYQVGIRDGKLGGRR
jgi:hypothetical protein